MRRRLQAWISPVVMAGLTIWAFGVTLSELHADEGFDEINCYVTPELCLNWDGECEGFCAKRLNPGGVTCCWWWPEPE